MAKPLPVDQIISPELLKHLKRCKGSAFCCAELKKLIAAYEEVAFPQHSVTYDPRDWYITYEPCDWVGPDKPDGTPRRCILALGHQLMKVGYQGHAPDVAVPLEKPQRAADPYGYPPVPEDLHAKE